MLLLDPSFTGTIPFPWKSMRALEPDYRMIWIDADCMLVVKQDGLTKWLGGQRVADGQFAVSSGKFGECPLVEIESLCPVTRRLIAAFREAGATPRFETEELGVDGPKASYLFDISTDKTKAIYELTVINHGREIVNRIFCRKIDPALMVNLQLIDRAIYALFKKYKLPTN